VDDQAVDVEHERLKAYELARSLQREKGWGYIRIRRELLERGYNISLGTVSGWLYHWKKAGRPSPTPIPESAKKLTKEKAYILGVLAGDGSICRGIHRLDLSKIDLSVTDEEFAREFVRCLKKIYRVRPSVYKRANNHLSILRGREIRTKKPIYEACLRSVKAVEDLLSYSVSFKTEDWRIPEVIKRAPPEIKGSYLRGFFDSEGTAALHMNEGCRYVYAFSKNMEGLKEVKNLLADIGIECKIFQQKSGLYGIILSGRKNIKRFAEFVGFTIKRKMQKLEHGLSTYKRTPSAEVDALVPKMIGMRKQGMLYCEIGEKLGIDKTTVHKRLSKLGALKIKSNVFK
jgi:intein-encoded DNA endonuclease-like protein